MLFCARNCAGHTVVVCCCRLQICTCPKELCPWQWSFPKQCDVHRCSCVWFVPKLDTAINGTTVSFIRCQNLASYFFKVHSDNTSERIKIWSGGPHIVCVVTPWHAYWHTSSSSWISAQTLFPITVKSQRAHYLNKENISFTNMNKNDHHHLEVYSFFGQDHHMVLESLPLRHRDRLPRARVRNAICGRAMWFWQSASGQWRQLRELIVAMARNGRCEQLGNRAQPYVENL